MQPILILIIGIISGFLGSTVGGGGMIAIPALLLMGFPAHVAVASKKVGDVGAFLVALREYQHFKKIDWKMARWLILITIIGSILGSTIMIYMNKRILETIVLVIIAIFLPIILFNHKIGLIKRKVSKKMIVIGIIFYFAMIIINAIASAGGASIILIIMMTFFGYKLIEGYATNIPSEFINSIIPATIYFFVGYTDVIAATLLLIGSAIGGLIGSKLAIKKENIWMKWLFGTVVIIMVLKIVFFNGLV